MTGSSIRTWTRRVSATAAVGRSIMTSTSSSLVVAVRGERLLVLRLYVTSTTTARRIGRIVVQSRIFIVLYGSAPGMSVVDISFHVVITRVSCQPVFIIF